MRPGGSQTALKSARFLATTFYVPIFKELGFSDIYIQVWIHFVKTDVWKNNL